MRFPLGLALALTALLAAAGPALGRPGPPLGPFPHQGSMPDRPPVSDGERHLVINAAPGAVRVYDTRAHLVHQVTVPAECAAEAATRGVALLVCNPRRGQGGSDEPYLLRLPNHHIATVPDSGTGNAFDRDEWRRMGRHWISGITHLASASKVVGTYLNWRTGERRTEFDDDGTLRDVDDRDLREYPQGADDREGSLMLRGADPLTRTSLDLLRPGPDTNLSKCRPYCRHATLAAGLVTWAEGGVVRSYDARLRRRFGWRLGGDGFAPVVHTRTHVLVAHGAAPDLLWARVRP